MGDTSDRSLDVAKFSKNLRDDNYQQNQLVLYVYLVVSCKRCYITDTIWG